MREHSRITFRSLFRIRVSNRPDDQLIGYLGDLSEGGVKLVSDTPVEVGRSLQLRLKMRDREGQMQHVDIDATCTWTGENSKSGYFEAGLTLDSPSSAFSALVGRLRATRNARD